MRRSSCCQAAAASLVILALCFGPHCTATRYTDVRGRPYTVEYDRRSIRIDGKPTLLLSGDVHYTRFDPDEQTRALALAAADGLNTVQTYAFWSVHEPEPGVMRWGLADGDSRANVTSFLRKAADAGLFVSLRKL